MAGRNCADIVFCIDASGSMRPCIEGVRNNIEKLLEGLKNDGQINWDVRYDFLAFHDNNEGVHWYRSVNCPTVPLIDNLYGEKNRSSFFTTDIGKFRDALKNDIEVEGEEMQLLALDIAMDFPWRNSGDCHRVVVLMTDEAVETGVYVEEQKKQIDKLIEKAQDKRIKLFIIAPESEAFYKLSELDRCEYTDIESDMDGLRTVDFSKLLQTIGKSVSVSQTYDGGSTDPMPLYDQLEWGAVEGAEFRGE